MKLTVRMQKVILELICLLYILLFVYAAVSKLLDFENFQVQLGQSPLLSAFAGWVSWGVPIVEIIIALMLVFPRFRLVGLYAAFSLMVMFTAYIYIILHYSSFVPCSCGGVLEKMSWDQHLIFNIVFILIGAQGILLLSQKNKTILYSLLICNALSIGIIVFLFNLSENITQ